jgi:hypothetical protein
LQQRPSWETHSFWASQESTWLQATTTVCMRSALFRDLQGLELWFITNVWRQTVSPIFKGPKPCPETSVRNYYSRLSKILKVSISQSISSPHFMEAEGSLPCSQQLVTCLTPEPDRVHTLPFTPWSSRYLSLHVPHQSLVCIFRLPVPLVPLIPFCLNVWLKASQRIGSFILNFHLHLWLCPAFHLPFRFSGKYVLHIYYIHFTMSCSSHTSWFDQLTDVFWT